MILDGVKVLDFTQYLAGPVATRLMAEMGAEIIKVEQAPNGDPTRTLPIMKNGRSAYFVQQSLGKKSICLDMSKPESQGIIEELVKACDIVIENYSKRAADKRGLDYATLSKINPRIIVASVSAFGRTGPYANKTGYDWIAQGFAGVMHMTGPKDGKPHPVGIGIADSNVGVHAFSAIGYALYYREKTGKGQYLDISMVDALYHMNEITLQGYAASDGEYVPMRTGEHHPLICPCGVYKSTDGHMVLLVLQGQWQGLCDAMGRPELASDPRFDSQESRAKNQTSLIPMIETWLQTFPDDVQAWQCLEDHRVPSGPVLSPQETINHEYYRGRGAIRTVHDPVVGKLDIPAFPLRFSEQTEFAPGAAPNLGEHNAEILGEVLGYNTDQINGLRESGVLINKVD
ncbi:MAG: crotonobetainyl-CoA:carnitine CoA-transferase CaiB-like acyl-CoA transferase [Gammaproteobacteria bacterium]|jgi:crotonobetainyl-CoA:carnitine CoA-transferase CaiB-like acyl-CoA transferase